MNGSLRGALMVCGTASDVGKSALVAGLCRVLARRGVSVAPFKGQNMALNSVVTGEGAEIGRAQYMQARAARVAPEAAMNPVLLKPTSDHRSQVVVRGRPWRTLSAAEYQAVKPELAAEVGAALADLRARFDVVICEGAGSPAEINLLDGDLVNLGLAARSGVPAVVVGDIDRGGVFAHLYGTVALLPEERRRCVRAFVINKFRGDPALLGDAAAQLEQRCGVPTLGVLPWLGHLPLESEDSMALPGAGTGAPRPADGAIDVAVVRLPRLSNFTDFDPLTLERGVAVRYVERPDQLGRPDLVVLPGTKSTVEDLAWLRRCGLADAVTALAATGGEPPGPVVLGICGGYQMLGHRIEDPEGVESGHAHTRGLGLLDVTTHFAPGKVTRWRHGTVVAGRRADIGLAVAGYEIHHGQPRPGSAAHPWFALADAASGSGVDAAAGSASASGSGVDAAAGSASAPDLGHFHREPEGVADPAAGVYGTSLHGVLEEDGFRRALLQTVAARSLRRWAPGAARFADARDAQIDRMADACAEHLDLRALEAIIGSATVRETA